MDIYFPHELLETIVLFYRIQDVRSNCWQEDNDFNPPPIFDSKKQTEVDTKRWEDEDKAPGKDIYFYLEKLL